MAEEETTPQAQSNAKPRRGRDVLIGLAITLALFVAAEIALRIYESSQQIRLVSQLDDWEIADPVMGWKPRPGFAYQQMHINSLGFRGPEITAEKPNGVFRIVALGDSTTLGISAAPSYAELLEGKLKNSRPADCPVRFEVVNAGVEGYSSDETLARLQHDVLPLSPDLLTVYVGWNDLYHTDPERPQVIIKRGSILDTLAEKSLVVKYALRLIYDRILPLLRPTTTEKEAVYTHFWPAHFEANLNEMIDLATENAIPIVFMTLPSVLSEANLQPYKDILHFPTYTTDAHLLTLLWRRYNEVIRKVGTDRGISVIDLAAEFERLDNIGSLFFDTLHFYGPGHEIAAEVLLGYLETGGWLPCASA